MARDFAPRPGRSPQAPKQVSETQEALQLPAPPSTAAGDLEAQARQGHSLERIPLRAERSGAPGAAAGPAGQREPPLLPHDPGQSLPLSLRSRMESAFKTDFADVRVHKDEQATAIGAHAFTRGHHIHLLPGLPQAGNPRGDEILGHELAHVVQQRQGRVPRPSGARAPINADRSLEAEADKLGTQAARGQPLGLGRLHASQGSISSPASQAPVQRGLFDLMGPVNPRLNVPTWMGGQGPRDSDMAGGGAQEKRGGSGHNATPTPGDGRSYAQMKADVGAAIEEAQVHVDHPKSTVTSVEQALPELQERYGLRSLELESRGEGRHAVVGKLNPKGEGEEVDLPMGGYGMDSDAESESDDDAHHAAPAQANRPMSALEKQKAEEERQERERRAKKAERSQQAAERELAAREQQRREDAKPRQHHYIYPSEMTGDIWHAAAAMILDPTAQVHFASPRDTQTREYEQHMHDLNAADQAKIEQHTAVHQARIDPHADQVKRLRHLVQEPRNPDRAQHRKDFKAAKRQRDRARAALENDAEIRKLKLNIDSRERNIVHIPKDRAKWVKNRASNEKTLDDLGVGGRSHHELVPGSYRTGNVEAHGKRQREEALAVDPNIKHVVHSQKETTRAIMNAVGPDGANKAQVVARLRAGMTGHADAHEKKWVSKRIKAIRARVKKLRKESGKEDA
ncbi:MAG: eCIS core domain-containing protein, partial [Archangium sp.]